MKNLMSILIGLFALIWLVGKFGGNNQRASARPTPQETSAEKESNEFLAAAVIGARSLKKAMRDPESFNLESALLMGHGDAVCYSYRARNGFNGVNVGYGVLLPKTSQLYINEKPGFAGAWTKACKGKSGDEVASNVRLLM